MVCELSLYILRCIQKYFFCNFRIKMTAMMTNHFLIWYAELFRKCLANFN